MELPRLGLLRQYSDPRFLYRRVLCRTATTLDPQIQIDSDSWSLRQNYRHENHARRRYGNRQYGSNGYIHDSSQIRWLNVRRWIACRLRSLSSSPRCRAREFSPLPLVEGRQRYWIRHSCGYLVKPDIKPTSDTPLDNRNRSRCDEAVWPGHFD